MSAGRTSVETILIHPARSFIRANFESGSKGINGTRNRTFTGTVSFLGGGFPEIHQIKEVGTTEIGGGGGTGKRKTDGSNSGFFR